MEDVSGFWYWYKVFYDSHNFTFFSDDILIEISSFENILSPSSEREDPEARSQRVNWQIKLTNRAERVTPERKLMRATGGSAKREDPNKSRLESEWNATTWAWFHRNGSENADKGAQEGSGLESLAFRDKGRNGLWENLSISEASAAESKTRKWCSQWWDRTN